MRKSLKLFKVSKQVIQNVKIGLILFKVFHEKRNQWDI